MQPSVHSLYIYPIKSCRGIQVDQAELIATGFKYDRHWMLVDRHGEFLSQRKLPHMALITIALNDEGYLSCSAGSRELEFPLQSHDKNRIEVQIWRDRCSAARVSTAASQWFSDVLDTECELVFLPQTEQRRVDQSFATGNEIVGFADGFPLLVLSLASMDELAARLGETVDIERFRPNIVIGNCAPHAEDQWTSVTINDIAIDLVKPCSRCAIPGVDPRSAKTHPSLLRTLAQYRRRDGKVYVGQNGLHRANGRLEVGQSVAYQAK